MALAHAVAGATRPSQVITWTRDDGTAEDLTGATITGKIRSLADGTTRDIAGTLSVTDAAAGEFTWAYAAADVATPGRFQVQFTAAFGTGATPARTDATNWEVKRALA